MEEKFKHLVEGSGRILITSHISPDPDALSSLLLLGATLSLNFSDKDVKLALEEKPEDLGYMPGYDGVQYGPVIDALQNYGPDLFILLDGNNYERCSRHDGQKIREYISQNQVKTIIIDHHQLEGKDSVDLFINNDSPATVQDVYELCFNWLKLRKPDDAGQIAMTGFYADTGGFVYVKAGGQKKLFSFAEELVSNGADIELVKNQLESYTDADMEVLSQLAGNVTHSENYTYSFLSDGFIEDWQRGGHSHLQLQRPTNSFLNNYIRNIGGRSWGFIVYRNALQGEGYYSVSFRSQGGTPDVSVIAVKLGGGGHKPAAGAKFEAESLEQAIGIVNDTISSLALR